MMPTWLAYALAIYLLIAATMLFLTWPYTEGNHVPRSRVIRDSIGWPFWALLLIVEAAEEGRRYWAKRRVE